MRQIVGYASGVFDLFHIGHLNILRHAGSRCDYLVAGVVTDEAAEQMKGRPPVVPLVERLEIVRSVRHVDAAFVDTSADKRLAWHQVRFDVLFKGDDWRGTPKGDRLEAEMAEVGVEVVYLPYTVHTSSTHLRAALDALTGPAGPVSDAGR
ncbi:adenylyltransferase/cytidyltransferase family protein [Streptomyces alkaliphilus]|uniref:Adenylyltransferase/cytidyltransferase family protein n=1 Tax=Streptomyces alkaliphilus TaxID=1472722 RepID=A0A7W3Y194_9ACTN|nr:adenylyltransferase/cytidyltransferase family protein [Streptomyces alkaliphilus]MBB0244434.1 adenylyltransferase/cytidyltransferase family protein [Streptomyces alkaliphilus]MQS07820.1 adenylyltransferase/cytidyltransferase family protein [Streptomyces alkaliphilus]